MEWPDYELLDFGQEARLERFGEVVLNREESSAYQSPSLADENWDKAHATYREHQGWNSHQDIPESWNIQFREITLGLKLSQNNKHIGIFPEQADQWRWLMEQKPQTTSPPKLLNLFGHTGAGSLAACLSGYEVTHVDASKPAINQGKENQRLSNLMEKRIRWIHEDAITWVERELKRKSTYHAILLDPPTFGRGPKGQIWKNDRDLPKLLKKLLGILDPKEAQFVVLNHYTAANPSFPKASLPNQIISGDHKLISSAGDTLNLAKWFRMDFGKT